MNATIRMQNAYHHTQAGTLMRVLFGLIGAGIFVGAGLAGEWAIAAGFAALMIAVLLLFHDLHVDVEAERIRLRFGIGLLRKSVPLADVKACRRVRNNPLYGWGIRYIGRGWLYNVSGLDAVELDLASGKRLRIGTDDPEGLEKAINARLHRTDREK